MNRARPFHFLFFRLAPVLLLGLVAARAIAQNDPPSRVARLNYTEGSVVFAPAGDNEWTDAALNRPLTRGDRLWTDKGSRAEIQVGSSAVRLDGLAHLEILALDDQSSQLSVTQGTVYVRIRSLPEGENFEIDTPNLAYRAAYPGDYRIDVDGANGTTRVTIHSGTGAVYGEGGQVQPLGGGQQVTFRTRTLVQVAAQESPPQDNFDRWAAERNRREDQSISARYVPREVVGYQQLDAHGQWMQDPANGTVWFPQGTPANWAPYRNGHWEWIAPWGWTWIDSAPWGFAPFHYGRWAMIGSRWAWVPGRIGLKPVYAPALVAFVGGSSAGRADVAWFPLAPGEAWQPAYQASPVYISNVNRNLTLQPNATYAHQRKPEALTAISSEDFHRGKPAGAGWLRIAANALTNAQIVGPPPMPERNAVADRQHASAARPAPPAPAQLRQVVADTTSTRQAENAQRQAQAAAQSQAQVQAQAQAKAAQAAAQQLADAQRVRLEQQAKSAASPKAPEPAAKVAAAAKLAPQPAPPAAPSPQVAEQAKAAEQSRRVEQARHTEQLKAAEQANRAEQTRLVAHAEQARLAARAEQTRREQSATRAEQARLAARAEQLRLAARAEQAQREQTAKRAEQAKREQLAKRDQARRDQLAQRAEQQRREAQSKRTEQARRDAVARREEQQRREAHAQHVEQARRAADHDAQVLAEQRTQREEQQAKRGAQEREQALREVAQREQAQREAAARQQQALAEQWRRDRQALEQQQQRVRQRPDLRDDRSNRSDSPRGIPILNASPLS